MEEFETYLELSPGYEVAIIVAFTYKASETVYHESMRIENIILKSTSETINVPPTTVYDLEARAYEYLNDQREKKAAQLENYHEGKAEDRKLGL